MAERRESTSFRFSLEDAVLLLYGLDQVELGADEALNRQKSELRDKLEQLRKVLGGVTQ